MKKRYQDWVNRMARRVNLGNILVRPNYQIDNAHATHDENGRMLIEYNPVFMQRLENYSAWAAFMVMAHEVAHHYNLDLYGRFISRHNVYQRQEMNADRFAGNMMKCYGAQWNQATDAFEALDFRASYTHPDEASRVEALKQGWLEADCVVRLQRRQESSNADVGKAIVGAAAGVALVVGLFALLGGD